VITHKEAAALLREYSILLDLADADEFRARTFASASRQLEQQSRTLEDLIATGELRTIRGVGQSVETAILELVERETFADLEDARSKVPEGVVDLLRIEGLGPKKAKALWKQAKITSIDELETAIRGGTLPKLPGLGAKTLERFLTGIERLREHAGRHLRHHALAEAEDLTRVLSGIPGVVEVFFGGSLRRGCETIGDLDTILVAEPKRARSVLESALAMPFAEWKEPFDPICIGRTIHGIDIELSVCTPEQAPHRKLLATGSKDHLRHLAAAAKACGYELSDQGLLNRTRELVEAEDEAALYRLLEIEPVPPPLREAELPLGRAGSISYPRPVELADFRGIIHNHSTYSDGHHTLREMAEAMIEMGYEYLGIADHSQAAAYAGGLRPERVREQWEEIDSLNLELAPFRILKGTEVDILPDGSLDYADELLAGFDYVVASIHSSFNMTEAAATDRLCHALESPHVDILGHPTGRLLLRRDGYPIDHETVIACAAAHGKGIELNSNPHRLDLDWRWLPRCIEHEVPVPICPDAHSIDGLKDIRFGVDVAAKGPLSPDLCPSSWSAERFLDWCQSHS